MRGAMIAAANVYRRARAALVNSGMKEDDKTYRPLNREDLRPFIVYEEDRRLGDSKKTADSWIWQSLGFIDGENLDKNVTEYITESELLFLTVIMRI